jgi:hypothetical protein
LIHTRVSWYSQASKDTGVDSAQRQRVRGSYIDRKSDLALAPHDSDQRNECHEAPDFMIAALPSAGLLTAVPMASVQTLKKIADTNKITVPYREAAVVAQEFALVQPSTSCSFQFGGSDEAHVSGTRDSDFVGVGTQA